MGDIKITYPLFNLPFSCVRRTTIVREWKVANPELNILQTNLTGHVIFSKRA